MANPINSPTVIGGIAVLVVVTAIILGLTGFKLKPAASNGNQNANTNSSTVSNTAVSTYSFPGRLPDDRILSKQVRLVTNKGTIVFTLDAKQAPLAVSSFVWLAEQGYFDGLTWHRVVPDFVIQGGDPTGTGTGGPGYQFADEPVTGEYVEGTVAMANSGPNTNGSQFFITSADDTQKLTKSYTIFGHVTAGLDIVKTIVQGDAMTKVTIEPTG